MRNAPIILPSKFFDREPPMNLEAEICLLGAMILDPSVIDEAADLVSADDFYEQTHRFVYEAITDVHRSGGLDLVSLQARMRQRGVYDECGGEAKLLELAESVPAAANFPYYAKLVAGAARARRMIDALGKGLYDLHTGLDYEEAISSIEGSVMAAARQGTAQDDFTVAEVANEITERWEKGFAPDDEILYPWRDVNEKLGGMRKGELVVVAARPSQGKTAWGLQVAMHTAQKFPVTFYSLEMKRDSLVIRDLCNRLRRSWRDVHRGNVDMAKAAHAIGQISSVDLRIHDKVAKRWESIQSSMRRSVSKHGTRVFLVDYIQLLRSTEKFNSRADELSYIAKDMQQAAKTLDVTIVALAQINRGGTQREGSRPAMADIKESGGIEEAGDTLVLLHRPEYYHLHELQEWRAANPTEAGVAEMIVAKQRNGAVGVVRTKWDEQVMQFADLNEGGGW